MFNTLDPRRGGAIVIRLAATLSVLAGQLHAAQAQGPGQAQSPAAAIFTIQQPAQDLGDALLAIARQTGTSVLFDPAVVKGRRARALSGQYTAQEALQRAIEGSGLVLLLTGERAAIVRLPVDGAAPASAPTSGTPASAADERQTSTPSADAARVAQMSRVEVTGSRLKRIDAEGPMPVNVYRREDLDRSGQPTLERFLSSLNEVSVRAGEGTYGNAQGQGTVQLRGMPLGSTVVLVNGRRVQASGSSSGNFFNINTLPLSAIDRIEIVPVGSSAVYGGDALAGVVNVILKRDMDGISLEARLAGGDGFEDGSLALAGGARWEDTSFIVVGSFSKATPLTMAERSFFRDADFRRFGGADARSMLCTPGTVTSNTTSNLPGVNGRTSAIPSLPAGQAPTIAAFAGSPASNLCSEQAAIDYALTNGKETSALHATAERRVSGSFTLFGELTYADDRVTSPQQGYGLSNVLVPATNAYNPFGVPVRVTTLLGPENGPRGTTLQTRYLRVLGGGRIELARGWELEATASASRDKGYNLIVAGTTDVAARTAALASSSPETALNPFATGRAAGDATLQSIWKDSLRRNHGQRDQVAAFGRGPLAELPAGPIDAIVGAEWAREVYDVTSPTARTDNGRSFQAVYGELRAPLLRGARAQGIPQLAALTLAARRDRYSDFGSAGTYQAGLELRPTRSLLIRGSAATSFKPPTLLQTRIPDLAFTSEAFGLVDPARGGSRIIGAEVLRTVNPGLQPEEGKAFTIGASWEPQGGTRLAATAWRIRVDRLIGLLAPQVLLDNESLFPDLVMREAAVGGVPGAVTRVRYAETNFGRVQTEGLDLEAAHAWELRGGRLSATASATRTLGYDVVIAPRSAGVSRLGRRYADYWAPRWKGRLSLGFDARAWSLALTGRYLGAYKDAGTSERKLGDDVVFDLGARLDLGKLGAPLGPMKSALLSVSVLNVGNRLPEYVSSSPYYDWTQADWRGRSGVVQLSVSW